MFSLLVNEFKFKLLFLKSYVQKEKRTSIKEVYLTIFFFVLIKKSLSRISCYRNISYYLLKNTSQEWQKILFLLKTKTEIMLLHPVIVINIKCCNFVENVSNNEWTLNSYTEELSQFHSNSFELFKNWFQIQIIVLTDVTIFFPFSFLLPNYHQRLNQIYLMDSFIFRWSTRTHILEESYKMFPKCSLNSTLVA
jgi:hypothetical protein